MSNDVAYPVFCTPDPFLALHTARRLMEFGRCEHSEVSAYAELSSVAEVRRMAKAMPGGWFRGASELEEFQGVPFEDQPALVVGVPASGLPAEAAAFEGRLPVEWEVWHLPVGSIEDAFSSAIGPNVGLINWESLQWPDAPEAGFHGESKHAEVTLLFNTRTRELDEPADDHTVLVHVRSVNIDGHQRREPYAHWLAAQVGLTVLGPAQRC
ncbi:hypothetical protein GCM10010222_12580 [Streptomyces tanashiensis]|uniref:hypothetical protein n=1 Tax=Streptomyces tanashiensis TaxID=67367 RepID=UPI0016759FB4|nr:hypothetical protein [Streptomyces tanashiensis]GGS73187.1 hypothetical protein GCM10010222_12580 [Streptomyces tanashiensis]